MSDPVGTEKIDKFIRDAWFLSNFYPLVPITLDGETYITVEHAYQAAKTLVPAERVAIRNSTTPNKAKRLGRTVTLRPDWESVKISVMTSLVEQKFRDPILAHKLFATGDAELIEGNTWGDEFWGVCNGVGENHLGKILMAIREKIRSNR